jgi:hypothetical protein
MAQTLAILNVARGNVMREPGLRAGLRAGLREGLRHPSPPTRKRANTVIPAKAGIR